MLIIKYTFLNLINKLLALSIFVTISSGFLMINHLEGKEEIAKKQMQNRSYLKLLQSLDYINKTNNDLREIELFNDIEELDLRDKTRNQITFLEDEIENLQKILQTQSEKSEELHRSYKNLDRQISELKQIEKYTREIKKTINYGGITPKRLSKNEVLRIKAQLEEIEKLLIPIYNNN